MTKSKTTKAFKQAYRALNREQKKAVDTLDGPVMVVAGPGTGKTQTIALRIANILCSTDVDASSVLALTFTDSGARAMRERLNTLIGTTAYYCHISTFHSFCIDVIKDNPDVFTIDPSSAPFAELDKLRLVYSLLEQDGLQVLRPLGSPHHYAASILGAISNLKREGASPAKLAKLLAEEDAYLQSDEGKELKKTDKTTRLKNLAKNRDLLELYQGYETYLKKMHLFDFDDMVAMVVDALRKNEELLTGLQERYQYLLVDEYQDTNSAQNELLLQLASYWGESANLFVVGDPDQSIFRFQGASIENQLSFIKHFPRALVVTLSTNYRSPQRILDAAHNLISHNNLRVNDVVKGLDPHLKSVSGLGAKINYVPLASSLTETIFIALDIQAKLKQGVSPSEIVIIYRNNKDSSLLADTLAKLGIATSVQGGRNVLEQPVVKNFVRLLRVIDEIHRRKEDEDLFTVLHYRIFQIKPLDILKVSRLAGDRRLTLFDVIVSPQLLDTLELGTRHALETTLSTLGSWSQFGAEHTFVELFEEVLSQSGYLNSVLQSKSAYSQITSLNTLFSAVKSMNQQNHHLSLASFLENLRLMEENNIRIEESVVGRGQQTVTLSTAHRAKGLEWDHVYLYRAGDKVWGGNHSRELIKLPEGLLSNFKPSDKEKNEDERRLFYVALTRSRKTLTISHPDINPSLFVGELGEGINHLDPTPLEIRAATLAPSLLALPTPADLTQEEQVFLSELVSKFSLSVTALNTYLECAYKFKLDKLLKVPHAKKPHLAFGTAIHKSLEYFYRELKESGKRPSKNSLITAFQRALAQEVMSATDLRLRQAQGERVLSTYYDFHLADLAEPLFLEKFFQVNLDDIKLSGKIDRVEWLDESSRSVRVIDYKTGQGKSVGDIEGTTKTSRGDLKRQLVFYKLLLDLDHRLNNLHFGEAVLDFVQEPSEKNKDGLRRLHVTNEEVAELKKLIKSVSSNIHNLQFSRTTDYSVCDKCYFKDHCWPNGIPTH